MKVDDKEKVKGVYSYKVKEMTKSIFKKISKYMFNVGHRA